MALVSRTIDEETAGMVDTYDASIAPKKVWRNNRNKLYLIFKSIAAGFVSIRELVIASSHRFDPQYCTDDDLLSTAKLVGTEPEGGSGSVLDITVMSESVENEMDLPAGTYIYTSSSGMAFSFVLAQDVSFAPLEQKIISAVSAEKGSFHVLANGDVQLARSDGAAVPGDFRFSCADNEARLGYEDEDAFTFRQRLLTEGDRQDHIKELELAIKSLPNIFECNLVYNQDATPNDVDGITLQPMELLITITGVPTDEIARLTATRVLYQTHQVSPGQVVWYYSDCYIGGRYAVYYNLHGKADFSLDVTYRFDSSRTKQTQVEKIIKSRLAVYQNAVRHVDIVNEQTIYKLLEDLGLPDVTILDVNVLVDGSEVSYFSIPKTRLPNLTGITFHPLDTGSVAGDA
jgi:hypothetical protein